LPWSPSKALPLVYNSAYHNFHHSKSIGNYATSFYLFELIIGTNKTFFDLELAKAKEGQDLESTRLEAK
jgi:sterol desaturase/sphingolipid hydroxylase (fatty acid hydroxylase superfamily)